MTEGGGGFGDMFQDGEAVDYVSPETGAASPSRIATQARNTGEDFCYGDWRAGTRIR